MSLSLLILFFWANWANSPEGVPLCPADAALKSVQFVDGDEGWCVGQEGLILHSIDSGKTWEKQPTGTHGTLECVHFLNPYEGWAVGHDDQFPANSNGIVLYTRDGGVTWKRILSGEVPALYGVQFHGKIGWIVGGANLRFPGGILLTRDGGVRWEPGPGMLTRGWVGISAEGDQPRLVGPQGKIAQQINGQWVLKEIDQNGLRPIRSVWAGPAGQAIAGGEAGIFLREREGKWEPITGALSQTTQSLVDFHSVFGVGNLRFAAGFAGNMILRSEDEGNKWARIPVPGLGTIHSIHFADPKKGWMVGERGAIWRTENGGLQWSHVRSGGERVSHLAICPWWDRIPSAPLVQLGWVDGVHCDLYAVGSFPNGEPGRFRSGDLMGIRALGVTTVREGFGSFNHSVSQVASRKEVLTQLEKALGPDPLEALKRKLVMAIRSARPESLLLNSPGADPNYQGLESILEEVIPEAVRAASDSGQFPELIEEMGLMPWQVQRAFVPCALPSSNVQIDLMEIRSRIKSGIKDYCREHEFRKSNSFGETGECNLKAISYVSQNLKKQGKRISLLEVNNPGDWAKIQRKLEEAGDLSPEELRGLRRKNQVMQLVGAPDSEIATSEILASNLDNMLKGVDDLQAARVLSALARQSVIRGKWNLARELYLQFLNRYPTHPGATEAAQWVILHNASGEARRRHELRQVLVEGTIDYQTTAAPREDSRSGFASFPSLTPKPKINPASGGGAQNPGIALAKAIQDGPTPIASHIPNLPQTVGRVTTQSTFVDNVLEAKKWYEEALQSGQRLGTFGSLVAGDPRIRFSLASASRKLGDFKPTQEFCEEISKGGGGGDIAIESWRKAAAMELWLSHRKGDSPKPLWTSRKVEDRPYLDGNLNEPFWAAITPNNFRSPNGEGISRPEANEPGVNGPFVLFANDDQYLYVGIRVESRSPDFMGPGNTGKAIPRGHDTGLNQVENITILIDVDRDYSTAYLFRIDPRGWIDDLCWGDSGWNPRWFLSTKKENGYWETELAIPLSLLVNEKLSHGKSWAVNVFHHDPEKGMTYGLNKSRKPPGLELEPYDFGILYFQNPHAIPTNRGGNGQTDGRGSPVSGSRPPAKSRPSASQPVSKPGSVAPENLPGTSSDH